MEAYCCDETFFNLTGIESPAAYGRKIRETILQYCGMPVSIGIARTMTLARLANRIGNKSINVTTGVLSLVESLMTEHQQVTRICDGT